jgi:hypothetical protein
MARRLESQLQAIFPFIGWDEFSARPTRFVGLSSDYSDPGKGQAEVTGKTNLLAIIGVVISHVSNCTRRYQKI